LNIGRLEKMMGAVESVTPKKIKIDKDEYYKRRRAGETYRDIKNDYPHQDIRGFEGAYAKYGRKNKGKRK
jgi:hypothetical protein